jgi:hypothetical protein
MKIANRRAALIAMTIGVMIASGRASEAGLITYTETVNGYGSFGGVDFSDQLITITLTTDTSQITNPSAGLLRTNTALTTISVAGIGTGTLQTHAFNNQTANAFGFSTGVGAQPDILDVQNAAFASYNHQSAIGPIVGIAIINTDAAFSTTIGDFVISSTSSDVTMQATLASVPEPSSLALCGIAGAAGLIAARVRRKRAAG